MAKYFILTFSGQDEKTVIKEANEAGKIFDVDKPVRDLELMMLKNILRYARRDARNLDDGFKITDCLKQVEGVTAKDTFLRFTSDDIDFLKRGISSASGSPEINLWFDSCSAMLKQIKDPTEEEVDSKE